MSTSIKHPREAVHPIAQRLVDALRPYCRRIEVAGSLRRETQTVGDIEIVAIPIRPITLFGEELNDRPTDLDRFLDAHGVQFIKRGAKYQRFAYGRYEVDLFLTTSANWGSIFTIRTGSWEFSKWLVTSVTLGGAAPDGVQFREGRLYADGRLLATPEEEDVFAAIGLSWIPPIERTELIIGATRIEPIWNFE